MSFPEHVPNLRLMLSQVPSPDADWDTIREFAYSFHATTTMARMGRSPLSPTPGGPIP